MNFEEQFKRVLSSWLSDELGNEVTVIKYDQDTRGMGGCETCWYEETVVDIEYQKENGRFGEFTYYGSLAGLISLLGDVDV